MIYTCCSESRKIAVSAHPTLNGIDFLEVADTTQTTLEVHFLKPLAPGSLGVTNVFIEGGDRIKNIQILDVTVGAISSPLAASEVLIVKVAAPGDFSDYTLRLALDERQPEPPAGFDTVLSSVVFSFKVACPNEFDCQPVCDCPPENSPAPPDINYLAKDYATFRRLMLDRMALLVPGWRERSPADLGIALVELLAYTADYLSYRQDAVATEAYLGTARKRSSVRRHARLVDYFMHDGCNARAWLQIRVGSSANGAKLEKGSGNDTTKILTKVEGLPPIFNLHTEEYKKAFAARPKVFELMHDITLHEPHNVMHFYTWGDESCCLAKGATQATLLGDFPNLKPGDVLILAEELGPDTGEPQDANPMRRHAVRLTEVTSSCDLLFDADGKPFVNPLSSPPDSPVDSPPGSPPFSPPDSPVGSPPFSPPGSPPGSPPFSPPGSPPFSPPGSPPFSPPGSPPFSPPGSPPFSPPDSPVGSPPDSPPGSPPFSPPACTPYLKVTKIRWNRLDALPFPLCISTERFEKVSVALGNIVLVDHGMTVEDAGDGRSLSPHVVPSRKMEYALTDESCLCQEEAPAVAVPVRFRPGLANAPLTVADLQQFNADFSLKTAAAVELIRQSPRSALPVISLAEAESLVEKWLPQRDLLGSAFSKQEFVVETETDGSAFLRFGDNQLGARPDEGMDFLASYRIGNGAQGNVGAGALAHIVPGVASSLDVTEVSNPLAAQGGTDPESMEEVRQFAPQAFRTQERAVTPADYEEFAKKSHPDVQKVATTLRWTGSWRTFFLTADRMGGLDVDAAFETDLRNRLERYRMAGFDLEVDSPLFVPLEIEMAVCVHPEFFASDVKKALLEVFGNRKLSNGKSGVFHPDNFSFGQTVFTSPLIAAAMSVAGVLSVEMNKFHRQGTPDPLPLDESKLTLGRREIARCDNDRNFPDRGVFNLIMKGGK